MAPAELLDATGQLVRLTGRHQLTSVPVTITMNLGSTTNLARAVLVLRWAGPWPVDQRWWDALTAWRGCWLQVVLGGAVNVAGVLGDVKSGRPEADGDDGGVPADWADETALLLLYRGGRWSVAGAYG
jgi:protein ImuB